MYTWRYESIQCKIHASEPIRFQSNSYCHTQYFVRLHGVEDTQNNLSYSILNRWLFFYIGNSISMIFLLKTNYLILSEFVFTWRYQPNLSDSSLNGDSSHSSCKVRSRLQVNCRRSHLRLFFYALRYLSCSGLVICFQNNHQMRSSAFECYLGSTWFSRLTGCHEI